MTLTAELTRSWPCHAKVELPRDNAQSGQNIGLSGGHNGTKVHKYVIG